MKAGDILLFEEEFKVIAEFVGVLQSKKTESHRSA